MQNTPPLPSLNETSFDASQVRLALDDPVVPGQCFMRGTGRIFSITFSGQRLGKAPTSLKHIFIEIKPMGSATSRLMCLRILRSCQRYEDPDFTKSEHSHIIKRREAVKLCTQGFPTILSTHSMHTS